MDNLTHTLFAATLARTPLERAGRGTTAALILASNAPDIDIVTTAGGALSYLQWHRGPTHGPLGVIALGVVVAGMVWTASWLRDWIRRRRSDDVHHQAARFGALALVSILGVLLHVLMDVPTSYGTRLLSPFDWRWFAVDLMPIIDVYLLTVLGACLWFGREAPDGTKATLNRLRAKRVGVSRRSSPEHRRAEAEGPPYEPGPSPWNARRRNVVLALSLMAANYGVRIVAHREAVAAAPRIFGPTLPDRCDAAGAQGPLLDRWPIHRQPSARDAGRRCLLEIAALPTFASPFHWRLVAQLSNAYETRDIGLIGLALRRRSGAPEAPWRLVRRYPNHWPPVAAQASTARTAQLFLGFSRFPVVSTGRGRDGATTVTWTDLRFTTGPPVGRVDDRRGGFFTAAVVVGPEGGIVQERVGS
jgi:membrane-bound metal-dependent hydrolase YbcI (DUF457 family)